LPASITRVASGPERCAAISFPPGSSRAPPKIAQVLPDNVSLTGRWPPSCSPRGFRIIVPAAGCDALESPGADLEARGPGNAR